MKMMILLFYLHLLFLYNSLVRIFILSFIKTIKRVFLKKQILSSCLIILGCCQKVKVYIFIHHSKYSVQEMSKLNPKSQNNNIVLIIFSRRAS